MMVKKLVEMIERHAEDISTGLLRDLQSNYYTAAYHEVTAKSLYHRVGDVYRNLGKWLMDKTDENVRMRYIQLGADRYREGIPVSQVVYALLLTRIHLVEYVKHHGLIDTALQMHQEREFYHRVVRFFDKAVFYTIYGYEQEQHKHR